MKISNLKFLISKQRGFTLVELLIVISIIGVLTTLLMANFVGVRQRARDAQRKSDLRQIQSALELYRADQGSYPISIPNCGTSLKSPSPDCSSNYMTKIPVDSMGSSYYNNGNYYFSSDGTTYTLAACLENTSDLQGCTITAGSTQCNPLPAVTNCTSGSYYVLNNP